MAKRTSVIYSLWSAYYIMADVPQPNEAFTQRKMRVAKRISLSAQGLTIAWCALNGIVGVPVSVWSWSRPGGHGAGAQGCGVTGGAAADRGMRGRTTRPAPPACPAGRWRRQPRPRPRHPPTTRLVARAQAGVAGLGGPCHQRRATPTGPRRPAMWPGQKALQARRGERHGRPRRQRCAAGVAALRRPRNPGLVGGRHACRGGPRTRKRHARERSGWHRGRRRGRARRGRRGPGTAQGCPAWRRGRGLAAFSPPGRGGT
jgi:hypothetical protein